MQVPAFFIQKIGILRSTSCQSSLIDVSLFVVAVVVVVRSACTSRAAGAVAAIIS